MGKRNARNKVKLSYLNEINYIDKRIKRIKNNEEEISKLLRKRNELKIKLKVKRK